MTIHCAYDQLAAPGTLKPHPRNPNTHSATQIAALAAVIEGNGWRAPITVSNRSGLVVRGHGRLEAALLLGCDQVPVDLQDYATEADELADMVADNRLAELCEMDEDALARVLRDLQGAGHDVQWTCRSPEARALPRQYRYSLPLPGVRKSFTARLPSAAGGDRMTAVKRILRIPSLAHEALPGRP